MTVIEARAVSVNLGNALVLDNVSLLVRPGGMLGVLGPNGAGKTTLLRSMAGLIAPHLGEVLLDGQPIDAIDRHTRGRTIGYLAQDGASQWPVTVRTLIGLGRLPHRGAWRSETSADRAAVECAMADCDVVGLAERPVTTLSGGERTRVLLARVLAGEPHVLLADEPVAALDLAHQLDVMERLRAIADAGRAVVCVMHDLSLAARFCRELVLLNQGRVVAAGDPAAVLTPANIADAFGVRAHFGTVDGLPVVIAGDRLPAAGDGTD